MNLDESWSVVICTKSWYVRVRVCGDLSLSNTRNFDRDRSEDCAVKSAGRGYCFKVWRTFTPPGSIQRPGCLGLRFGVARISPRQSDAKEFNKSRSRGSAIPCLRSLRSNPALLAFTRGCPSRIVPWFSVKNSSLNRPQYIVTGELNKNWLLQVSAVLNKRLLLIKRCANKTVFRRFGPNA